VDGNAYDETCALLIIGCTLFRWLHEHSYNCLQIFVGIWHGFWFIWLWSHQERNAKSNESHVKINFLVSYNMFNFPTIFWNFKEIKLHKK
jgi:hypothetical protein